MLAFVVVVLYVVCALVMLLSAELVLGLLFVRVVGSCCGFCLCALCALCG